MAFLAASGSTLRAATPVLYGVTGDGASHPETLYKVDIFTGEPSLVSPLGNGNDGEEIAYNPGNGLILHASGFSGDVNVERILEWIDPAPGAVTPITISGEKIYSEVTALVYEDASGPGGASFLASGFENLYRISQQGEVTHIGPLENWATGLAFVGSTLYAVLVIEQNLATIDPATGAITSRTPITTRGLGIIRLTALAAHPCSQQLFAVMATGADAVDAEPGQRLLVTIDSPTGAATVVGNLGDSFAGLTFVGDGCRTNVGGAIGPLLSAGAQQAREIREAAAAATKPQTDISPPSIGNGRITPPNTGDAGAGPSNVALAVLARGVLVAVGFGCKSRFPKEGP